MSRFFRSILICGLVLQISSAHAKQYSVGSTSKSVQIYQNAVSSKPFEVVGKITVTAVMQNQLRDEMIKATKKFGGDAVIQYQIVQPGTLPQIGKVQSKNTNGILVGEQTQPTAEGIIIRFVDQGGVTEITEKTVVPIIN